jgi:hypothetical protein
MEVPAIWPKMQEIIAGKCTASVCPCGPSGAPAVGDSITFREATGDDTNASFVPGGDRVTVVLTSVEDAGMAGDMKLIRVRWLRAARGPVTGTS